MKYVQPRQVIIPPVALFNKNRVGSLRIQGYSVHRNIRRSPGRQGICTICGHADLYNFNNLEYSILYL